RHGPIGFTQRPLLLWRRHDGAQSYSINWHRAYYNVRQKMLADPSNSRDQTRIARRGFIDAIAGTVAQSKGQLGQRKPFEAAKSLAKAAHASLLFLCANFALASWWRKLAPATSRRASTQHFR